MTGPAGRTKRVRVGTCGNRAGASRACLCGGRAYPALCAANDDEPTSRRRADRLEAEAGAEERAARTDPLDLVPELRPSGARHQILGARGSLVVEQVEHVDEELGGDRIEPPDVLEARVERAVRRVLHPADGSRGHPQVPDPGELE